MLDSIKSNGKKHSYDKQIIENKQQENEVEVDVRDEISKLAKRIGRQVVIHKRDDINSVDPLTQVFGEPKNKLASKPDEPVRIVHDETTGSFMLLFIKDCMVEMRGIDYQKFQSNFSKLFDSLEEWMQEFFSPSQM